MDAHSNGAWLYFGTTIIWGKLGCLSIRRWKLVLINIGLIFSKIGKYLSVIKMLNCIYKMHVFIFEQNIKRNLHNELMDLKKQATKSISPRQFSFPFFDTVFNLLNEYYFNLTFALTGNYTDLKLCFYSITINCLNFY